MSNSGWSRKSEKVIIVLNTLQVDVKRSIPTMTGSKSSNSSYSYNNNYNLGTTADGVKTTPTLIVAMMATEPRSGDEDDDDNNDDDNNDDDDNDNDDECFMLRIQQF